MSIVGTAYVDGQVRYTTDQQGVGNHTYRCGIQNHIVKVLLQYFYSLVQTITR